MASGINIPFLADTSKFLSGTDDVGRALEEVSDSLDGLARDSTQTASRAGDGIADGFRDGARDAADDLERIGDAARDAGRDTERHLEDGMDAGRDGARRLESSVSDAFRSIGQDASRVGDEVGRSTDEGFSRAGEASETFANEARANVSETVSSFRGDMEDIPQIAQDILGGVSGEFGMLGGAITAGLAAGIGIAIAKLQGLAESNTEAATAAAEMGREFYDAGGMLNEAAIGDKVADIAFQLAKEDVWYQWGDQATTNIGLVKDALGDVDADLARDAFKALAGDSEAAARAQAELTQMIEADSKALQEHATVMQDGTLWYGVEGDAIQGRIDKSKELQGRIEEESGVQAEATSEVEYFTEIMGQSATATEDATAALQEHADALDQAAGNAVDLTGAENEYTVQLAQLTEDIAHNGQTMDRNTEAGRANRESLADLASVSNDLRDAQIAAGTSTQQVTADAEAARVAFIAQAEAAGLNAAEAAALADTYGLVPANVETLVKANGTEEAKAAITGVAAPQDAPVNVTTNGTEAAAQGAVQSVQGTTAPVDVTTDGTDAAVQGRIEGIKGKSVKVDVDDEYTVKHVQDRINNIKGRDVHVNVVGNFAQFDRDLANRLVTRSMDVVVNERRGTQVNP